MKIFIDANILVAVINKEYPVFTYASRVLSWATANGHKLVTTSVSIAITWYFAEKKHGARSAKERVKLMCQYINIADCGNLEVVQAAEHAKVKDLEDGLQYFSALNAGCQCIVTENAKDFYFSKMDVLSAEDFLRRYYKL